MGLRWDVLYRGPLASCNFGCGYCPFAKRTDGPEARDDDARKLARFVAWAATPRGVELGVLFTPWGEALVHRRYQRAIVELSRAPHVRRVAAQTNLSGPLGWLRDADVTRVGLWATWHPGETPLPRFLDQCAELRAAGVRFSAGIVGLREHLDAAQRLRAALPPEVYVWVNAYKDTPRYYDGAMVARFTAIDPLFPENLRDHPSGGRPCRTGETSFAVDGDGTMTRCHFVKRTIGNIYEPGFERALLPRTCPRSFCTCHLGQVHRPQSPLGGFFGEGLLERAPAPDALARFATASA